MEFEESQMNLTTRPVIRSLCRKKLVFIGISSIVIIIILSVIIAIEFGHKKKLQKQSIYLNIHLSHFNQTVKY